MEHCIVYSSTSVSLVQEVDLLPILQRSRHVNAQMGITSVMLFDRGNIVQVIEGEKKTIEALFGRIERDHRHTNVTKVFDGPIRQRLFADWSMGCRPITTHQLEVIQTIIDLHNSEWLTVKPSNDIVLTMLKVFYDG